MQLLVGNSAGGAYSRLPLLTVSNSLDQPVMLRTALLQEQGGFYDGFRMEMFGCGETILFPDLHVHKHS